MSFTPDIQVFARIATFFVKIARLRWTAKLGFLGAGFLILLAVFAPWIVPYDPTTSNVAQALQPPSWGMHWAGTDQIGRDVFSRLIVATRLDLGIALCAVALSSSVGILTGSFAGYYGGWFDAVTGRCVDVLMAFPLFILAIALVAALGSGAQSIIYATAIINLPLYIRFARVEVNSRRKLGWVEAARISGNGHVRTVLFVLIPNILPVMMVHISVNFGWAILNTAGLSFLGLGIQPPTAEWGIMVAEGASYIFSGKWWLALFPGFVLMFVVLIFNLLGDGLRDLLDPRAE